MTFYSTTKKIFYKLGLSKIPVLRNIRKKIDSKIRGKGIKIKEIEGSKMYLDADDEAGVSELILINKSYEEEETTLIKSLLKKDMVFADIGANIGYYSLLASKLCKKVYSLEPEKKNFEMLEKNIKLNNYENISAYNVAASDNEEPIKFYVDAGNYGGSSFGKGNPVRVEEEITLTPVILDKLLENEEKIDLIKIDVQGAELRVMKGMLKIIKRNPNIKIIMEFCPHGIKQLEDNPENLLDLIDSLGLTMKIIENGLKSTSKDELNKMSGKESVNLLLEKIKKGKDLINGK